MALTADQMAAIANERRWQELKRREAGLVAGIDYAGQLATAAANIQSAGAEQLRVIRDEIAALEAGGGQGLSDDLGFYSEVERAMRVERFAGKGAAIDYVKANPECAEAEATAAYEEAAQAARPGESLLQSASGLLKMYARGAVSRGLAVDDSWESFRAFVVATPREELLGL